MANLGELGRRLDQLKIGRRGLLKAGGLAAGATILEACGVSLPFGGPARTDVPSPSAATAAPTATASGEPARTAAPSGDVRTPAPTADVKTPGPTASADIKSAQGEGVKVPDQKDRGPVKEEFRLPKENGKYRTFDRSEVVINGQRATVLLQPDSGSLGPDHDTIFGLDLEGDVDTEGIEVISSPGAGKVLETRVVGIRRTDLPYVQFKDVLGGDAFDELTAKPFGGDEGLTARARHHAANSGHTHQKVVYMGDLGAFEKQFGENPRIKAFLQRFIRAQVPARLGIPESNFVVPKT